jgi:hypothetical protein
LRDSVGLPIFQSATDFAFMPTHPGEGTLFKKYLVGNVHFVTNCADCISKCRLVEGAFVWARIIQ